MIITPNSLTTTQLFGLTNERYIMNAEVNKLLATPELRTRLLASDNVPTGGTAADFARAIAQESANNARIVKAAGIRAE